MNITPTQCAIFEELSDVHDYNIAMNTETEDIPSSIVDKVLDGENLLNVSLDNLVVQD